jgi:hypothetical protein
MSKAKRLALYIGLSEKRPPHFKEKRMWNNIF